MTENEVSEELVNIYKQAEEDGLWIKEFIGEKENSWFAAVGSLEYLTQIEKENNVKIDINELGLGDMIMLKTIPGGGSSREEACRVAIENYKNKESQPSDESGYKLMSTFEERGYNIEAYIPNSDNVPLEFIVKAYREEDLVREIKVPMIYRPTFGPDVLDIAELEARTDKLMKELP